MSPFYTSFFCLCPPSSWSPFTDSRIHPPHPPILLDFAIPLTNQQLEIPRSCLILPSLSTWSVDIIESPLLEESHPGHVWGPSLAARTKPKGGEPGSVFRHLLPNSINSRLTSPKPRFWGFEGSPSNRHNYSSSERRCRASGPPRSRGGVRVERARTVPPAHPPVNPWVPSS